MVSLVQEFYKNKNVFITGGTGFVGKMLIEKLIRSCDVQGIYLLVREKKGFTPQQRLDKMFEDGVFDVIKMNHPDFLKKIHLLEGDVSKPNIGLSDSNKTILTTKINLVFHCAASLNMDANLKNAIQTNCVGTLELINIFENSKKLEALMAVSTAYSALFNDVIVEKFYDPSVDPKFVIEMSEKLEKKTFENICKGLLGDFPNSYVFSKHLAENIVKENCNGRAFGVFRPTIINASLKEPVEGWTDNVYGVLGITLAAGTGLLRVIYGRGDAVGDMVPVDSCTNALLSCAWQVNKIWKEKRNEYEPMVYNYSAYKSKLNMTYREYLDKCESVKESHTKYTLWILFLLFAPNPTLYWILNFLLHTIPMYIIDTGLWISGRKPMLKKVYEKVDKLILVLHFFCSRSWEIRNDNVMSLWKSLNPEDQRLFCFNLTELTEQEILTHFKKNCIGLKKYILKDDVSEEGQRRNLKRYKKLVIASKVLKYLSISLLVYIAYKIGYWMCSWFC